MTWWEAHANQGIIGLPPRSEKPEGWWPTEGFDGDLFWRDWDAPTELQQTGRTREEWLALADEMLARWREWRLHVELLT